MDLRDKTDLRRVVEYIKSEGGSASRTKISRYVTISSDLAKILKYACDKEVLKQESNNVYRYISDFKIDEYSYYDACIVSISKLWSFKGYSDDEKYIENTSRTDSKIVGKWTRPDITLVSHKKFPYTIGQEFEIVTFEVKTPESIDVLAVFEALSHSSVTTRSFVVFPGDDEQWDAIAAGQRERILEECARHGIGLIHIKNAAAEPIAVQVLDARKREIDHERSSNFLGSVLGKSGTERIAKWK